MQSCVIWAGHLRLQTGWTGRRLQKIGDKIGACTVIYSFYFIFRKGICPAVAFEDKTKSWYYRLCLSSKHICDRKGKVILATSSCLNWSITCFWSKSHKSSLYSWAIVFWLAGTWSLHVPEFREMGFLSHIILGHCHPQCTAA